MNFYRRPSRWFRLKDHTIIVQSDSSSQQNSPALPVVSAAVILVPGGRGVTYICHDTGMCHYFGYFFGGCFQIFGYLFGLFPDFWVSFFGYSRIFGYHFLVKFDFFLNNPDFGVLILIFPSMTLLPAGLLPAGLLFLWFYSSRFCSIMLVQRVPYCLWLLSVWVRIFAVLFDFNIILPLWIIFNVLRSSQMNEVN